MANLTIKDVERILGVKTTVQDENRRLRNIRDKIISLDPTSKRDLIVQIQEAGKLDLPAIEGGRDFAPRKGKLSEPKQRIRTTGRGTEEILAARQPFERGLSTEGIEQLLSLRSKRGEKGESITGLEQELVRRKFEEKRKRPGDQVNLGLGPIALGQKLGIGTQSLIKFLQPEQTEPVQQDLRQVAIQELKNAGQLVTENNINEVISQLQRG